MTKKETKIWTPSKNEYDALKMVCLEQAVKAGGNQEQILASAKAFHAWITEEPASG